MSFPGRLNLYRCSECDRVMVTIDRDEGDTSVHTRCLLNSVRVGAGQFEKCLGRAVSTLYECPADDVPRFEWVKPGANRNGWRPWEYFHATMGQLVLQRISR